MNITQKYNINVPRYTSYPTAPHFHKGVDGDTYINWVKSLSEDKPISIYIHIPFCAKLCYYCGCNTRIINDYAPAREYVANILKEIDTIANNCSSKLPVSHIHWGGGTPTFLSTEDLIKIFNKLKQHFNILPNAEIAMEIDPRVMSKQQVEAMAEAGLNRASLGVQDFDPKVQEAINRIQPFEITKQAVEWLRDAGISSINFDLIYGLPEQTPQTITKTVELTKELEADRIALFAYAHVPWMMKHQSMLDKFHLPQGEEKLAIFEAANKALDIAEYKPIGIDHFTKEDDSLYLAYKKGTLNRNFQGYTTDSATTLLAFGASAIGCLPQGYVQNTPSTKDYNEALAQGMLATIRGKETSDEDHLRRAIINDLMCNYTVNTQKHRETFNFTKDTLSESFEKLKELQADGLIILNNEEVTITETGKDFVRVVASCFDTYFTSSTTKHAKAV